MATYAGVQLEIETRMEAQWADDDVTVRYENEARKLPTGKHIKFFIRSGLSNESGFAGGKILYRRPGWIIAQCFIQAKEATQQCRTIADAVVNIFEGQQFAGITFRESEIVEVGNLDGSNGFYQINAKVFFDFDFERTV